MDAGVIASVIAATLNAGTPLLIAAIGILIHEKSGVLNLGVEGMMLMGAVTGFGVTYATGSFALGFLAGALAPTFTVTTSPSVSTTGTCFSVAASTTPGTSSFMGSPQQITGTPVSRRKVTMLPQWAQI